MIKLSSEEAIYVLTEAEKTHIYAEAYKQGQIDMKEIMDDESNNK